MAWSRHPQALPDSPRSTPLETTARRLRCLTGPTLLPTHSPTHPVAAVLATKEQPAAVGPDCRALWASERSSLSRLPLPSDSPGAGIPAFRPCSARSLRWPRSRRRRSSRNGAHRPRRIGGTGLQPRPGPAVRGGRPQPRPEAARPPSDPDSPLVRVPVGRTAHADRHQGAQPGRSRRSTTPVNEPGRSRPESRLRWWPRRAARRLGWEPPSGRSLSKHLGSLAPCHEGRLPEPDGPASWSMPVRRPKEPDGLAFHVKHKPKPRRCFT